MDWIEGLRQLVLDLSSTLGVEPAWMVAVVTAALLTGVWLTGVLRVRRYTQRLLHVLDESTPERMHITPRWNGFQAEILNPMPPFQTLTLRYTAPLPFDVVAMLAAIFGQCGGRLMIQASFKTPLRAELAWVRHGVPAQAFGKETNVSAWIHRKLAITGSEYATRGNRVEPLISVFAEFYIRFHAAVQRVCIQQEMACPLEIVVTMDALSPNDLPHLVASTWSLGQAATRR